MPVTRGKGHILCSTQGVLRTATLCFCALTAAASLARAQQAVSSITQSRLFTTPSAAAATSIEPAPSGEDSSTSEDDSFGAQLILKNQERVPPFTLFGDASLFYTTNVDLTPDHTRDDAFIVADAGAAWRRPLSPTLLADIVLAGAVFRYDRASELDFERISTGAGLNWLVPHGRGIIAFGRYDFIELLDNDGAELLRDHAFTAGAQKTFNFARTNFLTVGVLGIGGISTPDSQQREQAAVFGGYHLQVSRLVGADLIYRYAAQFYTEDGRIDHNQTFSLVVGYVVTRWLRLDASLSAARNDSNRPAFEYDVLNAGGSIRLNARF